MSEQKKWTVKEFRDAGLMALMPFGFDIYNGNDECGDPLLNDEYAAGKLEDCVIECIGSSYNDFIPALYVDYHGPDKKEESE